MTRLLRKVRPRAIWALLMGSLLAMLSGCVGNRMYRIESIQPGSTHSLAFIEFDDHGELWSQEQLSSALEHVEAENNAQDGTIVVTSLLNLRGKCAA